MAEQCSPYDAAAQQTVDLGNRITNADEDADLWDVADGLLAGAVQYWLYSRQPCEDRRCEDCAPVSTAELRMATLREFIDQATRDSEYFHSPNDHNVGRA